jgi:hypothetical protein
MVLQELSLVANVERLSELIDGNDSDLRRYAMSVVRFWGLPTRSQWRSLTHPIECWLGQAWYIGRLVGMWVMVLIAVS